MKIEEASPSVQAALTAKDRPRGAVPEKCKTCAHRYNDMSEGQNCRAIDRKITLSSGRILYWPGYAVDEAYQECGGEQHKPRLLGPLAYYIGL